MFKLIDYAISHARLTIATLIFLLVAGFVAYSTIPKEAEPDVRVPIIYTQLSQRGISPEDAERLLLRPVETYSVFPSAAIAVPIGRMPSPSAIFFTTVSFFASITVRLASFSAGT